MSGCPICGNPLPAPKKTGRPRQFCTAVCTERARSRRKQAAALLEFADVVENGSDWGVVGTEMERRRATARRERAASIRQNAAKLLAGIGAG